MGAFVVRYSPAMIEINNLTTSEVDEKFLKRVARKVLKGENKREGELSIALVGEGRIRKLNKKYRGEDRVTDVLAFGGNSKFNLEIGEIIICLPEIKKNAKRFNSTFKKELVRVLIHGILHILGYDHPDGVEDPQLININRDNKLMQKKESYYAKVLHY